MPLEETDVIDMISSGPNGELNLVITDAGITQDEDERYSLLVEKLRNYMAYCLDDDFADQNPQVSLDRIRFLVISRTAPSPRMAAIRELSTRGPRPIRIPVIFQTDPP